MTWFKVDDSFSDHPKVKSIPRVERRGAVALWTLAGSYAARHTTDGFLFADDVEDLGCTKKDARALVTARLWHQEGHTCERCPAVPKGKYLFHDWLDYQPSAEQVAAERKAAAERQKRARERAKSQREQGESHTVTDGVTTPVSDAVSDAAVTPPVTVPPTRPDPTRSTSYVGREGESSVPREERPPPPNHCPNHPGGTTAPCGPCGAAKRQRADFEAERTRITKLLASEAAHRDAQNRRTAIDHCGLCDDDGRRQPERTAVCDHVQRQPGALARARAAVQNEEQSA